jgi:hypothetical protein
MSTGSLGAFALSVGVPNDALAQVQDDAALANVPDEREVHPPAVQSGALSSSAGFDQREAELDPPLTTEELRTAHPDLQVRVTPPPALTVSLRSIYPFQLFGVGLGYDVYALPRLRVSALVSVGGSNAVNDEWRVSFYGDVGLGIVVLRSPTEVVTELKALATPAGRNFRSKRSAVERFVLGAERPPPGSPEG